MVCGYIWTIVWSSEMILRSSTYPPENRTHNIITRLIQKDWWILIEESFENQCKKLPFRHIQSSRKKKFGCLSKNEILMHLNFDKFFSGILYVMVILQVKFQISKPSALKSHSSFIQGVPWIFTSKCEFYISKNVPIFFAFSVEKFCSISLFRSRDCVDMETKYFPWFVDIFGPLYDRLKWFLDLQPTRPKIVPII